MFFDGTGDRTRSIVMDQLCSRLDHFLTVLKVCSVAEPSLFWFGSGLINSRRRIRLRLSAQAVIQYYKIK